MKRKKRTERQQIAAAWKKLLAADKACDRARKRADALWDKRSQAIDALVDLGVEP